MVHICLTLTFQGKQSRYIAYDYVERGAYGRNNFCVVSSQAEKNSLVLALEVIEASQELNMNINGEKTKHVLTVIELKLFSEI